MTQGSYATRTVPFLGGDVDLVAGLRARNPAAEAALFDRYANLVQRVLVRIMGPDPELPDLMHDVFVSAYESIHSIREAVTLPEWLRSVAVFVARNAIRRRTRRRWLSFVAPQELPELPAVTRDPAADELLVALDRVLGRMNVDERIAFVLRYFEEMTLPEVAEACRVSLATAKRRLARADRTFLDLARDNAVIADWLRRAEEERT